jgi:hypothetical protein
MINATWSYDAYVTALAALRELESRDAGTKAAERWTRAHQEIRGAALSAIAREIEYASAPQPGDMFLRRQGE